MIYIQIPEEHDAVGFLAHGVADEHLALLNSKQIPFKKLEAINLPLPGPSQPHDEEI
jgi:hypothetical protein